MARRAAVTPSVLISTKITSGTKPWVRRMTGSVAVRGMVWLAQTVRATLVPSTTTCRTARWSLSVANTATDNSGMDQPRGTFGHLTTATANDQRALKVFNGSIT